MLVENQKVEVHWCPANRKRYESFGYVYTGMRDSLIINAEHLSPTSHIKVLVRCDYCGKIYKTDNNIYIRGIKTNGKACCKSCSQKKIEEVIYEQYGVKNIFELEEVQDRIKETNLQKYGHENPGQAQEVKEKIIASNLEKYGVPYAILSDDVKKKAQQTNIRKFGVDNPFKKKEFQDKAKESTIKKYGVPNASYIPEVIEKRKETSLKKRGVPCPFQDQSVKNKIRESLYQNGNVPVSKAEIEMGKILIELYGKDNCIQSYPFENLSLDCFVKIKDTKIDVEYDGWYWHKNKQEEDKRRNCFLIRRGFKVLRFQANNAIPTKEQIQQAVEELLSTSKKIKIIKLDI